MANNLVRERRVTLPAVGTALLLIDVINDLAFAGARALIEQAEPMALRIAALKQRERSLTLVLMAMFAVCLVGQLVTGLYEYRDRAGTR